MNLSQYIISNVERINAHLRLIFFCTSLFLCIPLVRAQTQDSLQLSFAKLNWKDVKINENLEVGTRVISGSRSEKEIADLPFTIFVVTGEEIRQKGYLTLTDVLKRLPGIRVSQPGSALEGETFLMRGLSGNAYAKILINDVPIKPFVVSGMPIGAQLPIREAERIEIIYGPAATLYGADASAGVINIILKDTDRPVYVQSDLGFGATGFKNLDIMFAGKMGKGKRVLRFKLYGNYTALDDRRVKYDRDSLYNPKRYEDLLQTVQTVGFSYLDRPNYRGVAGSPLLGALPHLSNTLGIDLRFRNWQISSQQLSRRDHSSIGLSPYAVSYANPLNYFGERINTFNINYSKTFNRFRFKASIGALNYETDERSSYSYVTPLFNFVQQISAENYVANINQIDSMRQVIDNFYFSESRFSSASSTEGNLEVLLGFSPNKKIEIAAGFNLQGGVGNPLSLYNPNPLDPLDPLDLLNDIDSSQIIPVETVYYVDMSSFLECYFNIGKWNAILGGQAFVRRNDYLLRSQVYFNPRVALQYRWTDQFSLRFSTGRSFRYPSPYYSATSFNVSAINFADVKTGTDLSPEQTYSFEFGSRWTPTSNISMDASAYYTRTTNFIRYTVLPEGPNIEAVNLGYSNDAQAYAELYGVQSSITFKNIIPSIKLSSTLNLNYAKGKESSDNFSFDESAIVRLVLDGLRSQPAWIGQLDIEMHPFKKWRLLFENTWMTKSFSRNVILYQVPDLTNENELFNAGYYTLDFLIGYQFNKNIVGYFKINNVFSKKYAGIDATDDGDGLLYNPQSKRYSWIGINYRLE